mmetsp:Transcript_26996/g.68001  ORF Transcript_26996/g.68001 Transcript_26996/m.68001 type:complete len:251 (+) Transcript_26996:6951-7703(+)
MVQGEAEADVAPDQGAPIHRVQKQGAAAAAVEATRTVHRAREAVPLRCLHQVARDLRPRQPERLPTYPAGRQPPITDRNHFPTPCRLHRVVSEEQRLLRGRQTLPADAGGYADGFKRFAPSASCGVGGVFVRHGAVGCVLLAERRAAREQGGELLPAGVAEVPEVEAREPVREVLHKVRLGAVSTEPPPRGRVLPPAGPEQADQQRRLLPVGGVLPQPGGGDGCAGPVAGRRLSYADVHLVATANVEAVE